MCPSAGRTFGGMDAVFVLLTVGMFVLMGLLVRGTDRR